jgi:hypothetical protein
VCLVKVEEALDWVGPMQSALARREKGVRVTDLVNNDGRRFEWVVDELQSGIELFDEGEIRRPIGDMLREVEPRDTRKVELGEVVCCADDTADGDIGRPEPLQTTDVRFGRAWLGRSIGESNRTARALGDRDQASELIAREPAQEDSTIGLTFDQAS